MRKLCCLLNTSSGLVDVVVEGRGGIIKKTQRFNGRGKEGDEKVTRLGSKWKQEGRRIEKGKEKAFLS